MNLPTNLKQARTTANMTQAALADALGVRQKDISRWEHGQRTPNPEYIAKICRVLQVSADILLETGIK